MHSHKSGLAGKKKKLNHIGQYEIGRTLGEGSFSKVKLGTDVFTGKKYAIKIVDWSLVDDIEDQTECVDREIRIMKLLDHPNIVKLYDIISHKDDKKTFLVLEYVSKGELFDYIVANGRIKEAESRRFWRQLISAVELCHSFLVVHRDLKPSNLLLAADGSIKITDFGLSNTMTPGKLFTTWCGSLYYSAPEIVEEKKYTGPAVDVWSMGVILYALVNGRLPWSGKTDLEKIRQIVVSDMSPLDRDVTDDCADLIKRCLTVDPNKRITIPQIREHKWTNDGYDEPPPCMVPKTTPVEKVAEHVLQQLIFLGILDDSPAKIEEAKRQVLANEKTQLVFAYHILIKKPQLLVSASFLPRDKIKAAVSKHRLQLSQSAGVKVPTEQEKQDLTPKTVAATKQDQLDDLNDLLNEMDGKKSTATKTTKKSDVDALADDLDALMDLQAPKAPKSSSPKGTAASKATSSSTTKKRSKGHATAHTGHTRRRSRTVSAGSGNAKPPKMSDILKYRMSHGHKKTTPAAAVDAAIAVAAERSAKPANAAVARSSAGQSVQTRPRSASMGQRNAQKPQPVAPTPQPKQPTSKTGTWTANLFKRNKKKEKPVDPKTAGSTWDPSVYAAAKKKAQKAKSNAGPAMRTVKGVFKCATTSTRPPEELVAAIENALINTGVVKWKRKSDWLFRCAEKKSKVRLEIEVVNIEKLDGVFGIRFARISGDSFAYKQLAEELMLEIIT